MTRTNRRVGVVLFQLGGPDTLEAIEPFLYNLFCDPDIIDFPFARIGRKPLLLIGSAGMAATLFAMVYAFANGSLDPKGALVLSKDLGLIAVVAANLYVIFFNVSWGPVMWVMLGEMFPNQIRGSALAVAGFAQWFANYLVAQSFPVMSKWSLAGSYVFYAVSAVISFFLVQKFIHETKGKELEEMRG